MQNLLNKINLQQKFNADLTCSLFTECKSPDCTPCKNDIRNHVNIHMEYGDLQEQAEQEEWI